MNGDATSSHKIYTSKIPVVSPSPLRRWNSMRERKSSEFGGNWKNPSPSQYLVDHNENSFNFPTLENGNVSRMKNKHATPTQTPAPTLRRGTSFIERGEKANERSRRISGQVGGVRTRAVASSAGRSTPSAGVTTAESRRNGGPPCSFDAFNDREIISDMKKSQTSSRIRSMSLSISQNQNQSSTSVPFRSSAIENVSSPRTPPSSPSARHRNNLRDWDSESITSTMSNTSLTSCEHNTVAKNGTTFSGKSMKYIVHCSEHARAGGDYLTPTQRAQRQIKNLKLLLQQAEKQLEQKDGEILKLTKEVVELRMYKAALNSPEEDSTNSDVVTIEENQVSQTTALFTNVPVDEKQTLEDSSPTAHTATDSGNFEDYCSPQTKHPTEQTRHETADKETSANIPPRVAIESECKQLVMEYEKRIQQLVRMNEEECNEMRQKHNHKVEELLQIFEDINARYWKVVPNYKAAKERIKDLEKKLENVSKKVLKKERLVSQECQTTEPDTENPTSLSVVELSRQLEVTQQELEKVKDVEKDSSSTQMLLSAKEAIALWVLGARKTMYKQLLETNNCAANIDPEITLQFLKSAIYYFLTDKENNQGHLRAILSILGFNESEINNIDKARNA